MMPPFSVAGPFVILSVRALWNQESWPSRYTNSLPAPSYAPTTWCHTPVVGDAPVVPPDVTILTLAGVADAFQ